MKESMTPSDVLTQVNVDVNKIPYANEVTDDWTPALPTGGDCDSSATAKMQRLFDLGWPIESMRLAVCLTEKQEAHCVLLVDMDGQTLVLDNRHPLPMEFQLLPYEWIKLQVPGTQKWEWAKSFIDNLKGK
jgi:predicted transglutaminase-like cysteine proteinase